MQTITLLRDLFAYGHWANRRLLDLLTPGDPLRLFAHILGAERVWWGRIQGDAAGLTPWPELSLDECRELAEAMPLLWSGYLSDFPEERLSEVLSYTNLQGITLDTEIGDILMHVANHGTYHRAQIARALSQQGVKPPGTDYILYAREREV